MTTTLLRRTSVRVLIGWTIAAAFLGYLIYRRNQNVCESSLLGQEGCAAAGVAPSFWQPFLMFWVIGLVIGGIVWLAIRPKKRMCPVCGDEVPRGLTACPSCGHDFSAAAGPARASERVVTATSAERPSANPAAPAD
jgi:hypothetical protein